MAEIKTVLCPMDFSNISEQELQLAVQICETFGARLVLQHNIVSPPISLSTTWMWSETHLREEKEWESQTEHQIRQIFSKLPVSIKAEGKITHGSLDESILFLADEVPADLIIMGTHGRSSAEHVSTTERVLANTSCPVLATQEAGRDKIMPSLTAGGEAEIQEVLVPMDFTPYSLHALEYAYSLLDVLPVNLNLVHVEGIMAWDDVRNVPHLSNHRLQRLEDAEHRLRDLIPANLADRVKTHVSLGPSVDEICNFAEMVGSCLIIMGIHHKGIINKLLTGATSYGVLHKSKCPVWFIPEKARMRNRTRETVEALRR